VGEVDTILDDFNCYGGTKKRALGEVIAEFELDDIGTTQHTHEWGKHKCRIDRVLTKGGGRPWAIEEGWGCLSDHTAIGARAELKEAKKVTITRTDWRKVDRYVETEKEKIEKSIGKQEHEYKYAGQAVEELARILKEEWTRTAKVCERSKRWWTQQFKQMRKEAAKDKGKRKAFRKKIKEAKQEQWRKFVKEEEDVWKIARVARNLFNLKERCGELEKEYGEKVEEDDDEGKCAAFLEHNIICGQPAPVTETRRLTKRAIPKEEMRERVRRALMKTRNNSTPGPDGITWRLPKAIIDRRLGRAVLDDMGQTAELGNGYYGEEGWRNMTMVMIPKPGKEHSKVKGWRPIVLLNTVGKLANKVIA